MNFFAGRTYGTFIIEILSIVGLFFFHLNASTVYKFSPTDGIDTLLLGRRDYLWEVDTIANNNNYFNRIWGDSDSNIWIIGDGGELNNNIMHYNGTKWSSDNKLRFLAPSAIFGTNSGHIWVAGIGLYFWKYEGTEFVPADTLHLPQNFVGGVNNLWGDNLYGIYGAGVKTDSQGCQNQLLVRYNGVNWVECRWPETKGYLYEIKKSAHANYHLIQGVRRNLGSDSCYVYKLADSNITIIYKGENVYAEKASIQVINEKEYIIIGKKLFLYDDTLRLFKDFSNTNFKARLWGRNESDLFCKTNDGIGHYNGIDLVTIIKTKMTVFEGLIFESAVFFLCHDNDLNKSIIIKGKLPAH